MKESQDRGTVSVYVLLMPGVLMLDFAAFVEPLRIANQLATSAGMPPPFSVKIIAPDVAVKSSLSVDVAGCAPLPSIRVLSSQERIWVAIIGNASSPVISEFVAQRAQQKVQTWLRTAVAPLLARNAARLLTVCGGALIAAEAGLLDGRHCTTHHELTAMLKKNHPRALVESDRIYVMDGPIATSAGVTAGIDLALAVVNERCGATIANAVARDLVVYWRRAGGDPQLSPLMKHRNHLHPAVHRAQDAILARPNASWSAGEIARAACVSERHVRRLFVDHAGVTPIAYLNTIRVALAREALQQDGVSVEIAASRVGFNSARQLRDAWRLSADDLPSASKRTGRDASTSISRTVH
jgi:transcriptional regulator GlxA family with amidase domain